MKNKLSSSVPTVPDGGNTKPPSVSPSKHWFFTYNNYNKDDVPSFISLLKVYCEKYIFQSEVGKNGTPHLQGYICFANKNRPLTVFKTTNIHWEKVRNIKDAVNYCRKSDTHDGLIRESYNIKEPVIIKTITIEQMYLWQKTVLKLIANDPDDRKIYWYYDPEGNRGKSTFCKYLVVHHGAIMLSGKGADMKFALAKYYEKNEIYPVLILIDIPRCNKDFVSYSGIEEIKNGLFFSCKYEATMVLGNCPFVICFSNSEPDYDKMSRDRWDVIRLP